MTPGKRGWVVLFCIAALFSTVVFAHDHAALGAAGKFYQTWMMPNAPHVSCCHDDDCAASQARFINGTWEARWTDNDAWVHIPHEKIERVKDTPDGRAHLCGRRGPLGFNVFCFVVGSGS